jgi:hypothetical protein
MAVFVWWPNEVGNTVLMLKVNEMLKVDDPPPLRSAATETTDEPIPTSTQHDPLAHPDKETRIQHFRDSAFSLDPVTDKTQVHKYHTMYGIFLLPYAANKPKMKMLEIGLGCNMGYGPGASVALWKMLFPQADLWEAEYVKECVDKAMDKGQLNGINILVGDQADMPTLDRWIQESGGKFDIVIDDGGHHNCQISNSFDKLWPEVTPGGIYFIEDLHVGRWAKYKCDDIVMSERLKDWTEQLIYSTVRKSASFKHKIPLDVDFVYCQEEACVVGKKKLLY